MHYQVKVPVSLELDLAHGDELGGWELMSGSKFEGITGDHIRIF